MQKFATMKCRKCNGINPFSFFAPVKIDETLTIVVCEPCAEKAGFLCEGVLKKGYSL